VRLGSDEGLQLLHELPLPPGTDDAVVLIGRSLTDIDFNNIV